MTTPAAPEPDPLHNVRGRLSGVPDALHPEEAPRAVALVALALDELVDPTQPPSPWEASLPGDLHRALERIYDELGDLIPQAGSPRWALAAGQAAR